MQNSISLPWGGGWGGGYAGEILHDTFLGTFLGTEGSILRVISGYLSGHKFSAEILGASINSLSRNTRGGEGINSLQKYPPPPVFSGKGGGKRGGGKREAGLLYNMPIEWMFILM